MLRVACLVLCLALLPATARADEHLVAISLGYGSVAPPEQEPIPQGGSLGLDYEFAFSRAVAARASVAGGLYVGDTRYSGSAVAGLVYQLDALDLRPYGTVGLGGQILGGGKLNTTVYPLLEVGAGLDLKATEHLVVGVGARLESILARTSLFAVSARVGWMF